METKNQTGSLMGQNVFAILFFPLTILALYFDGTFFEELFFDGRLITNIMTISFLVMLYLVSDSYMRKLLLVMVPLSFIGELIFSEYFELYEYKTSFIPIYVPFGHSVLYISGCILAKSNVIQDNQRILKKIFHTFFALLFLAVGLFLNDYLTLIFGVLFFILLKRKDWDIKYSVIALCVIIIELSGTYFQCWKWGPLAFGYIPTINPPMGALALYLGGDGLLVKIVRQKTKKTL